MDVRPGYKMTEVGVIPEDWILINLLSLSAFITKGSTPTTYGFKWEQGGVLFLRSECVAENGLDLSQSMFISEAAHASLCRSEIREGDILITITGNVGRTILFKKVAEGNINQHIARVRIISQKAHSEFIYYILTQPSYRTRFNSITTGQAYPQISLKQVRETKIPFPPTKAEQSAIATALSDTDALIESLEKLIAKKRQIKRGAMQEFLTGKRRLPGFTGEWGTHTIEQLEKNKLVRLLRGKVISKKDIERMPGDCPIYSSSVCNDGLFGHYGEFMFHEEMITWSVDGGGHFFYRPKHKFSVTNVCGYMRVDTSYINYQFLAVQLQLLHGRKSFDYLVKAHPSVIRKAYALKLPALSEQTAIATILSDMDTELSALDAKLIKVRAIKQGMMHELLTGRIRLV